MLSLWYNLCKYAPEIATSRALRVEKLKKCLFSKQRNVN